MQPQYGNMTSDVMVVVVVEDVNDHPPTFGSNAPYTAFVREDAPLDSLIYFDGDGYIYVFDADQVRWPKCVVSSSSSFLRGGVLWTQKLRSPPLRIQSYQQRFPLLGLE